CNLRLCVISVGQKNQSMKTKGSEKPTMRSDDVAIDTEKDEYIQALEVAFNLKKFTVGTSTPSSPQPPEDQDLEKLN
nr:hypothetical protein CTI12_AA466230 [Tanacetum cinerariifolium]